MKTISIALLMFFTLGWSAWSEELGLFFIQRSKNKNEVHYQLQVDDKCHIVSEEPVTGYWRLLDESSDKTKSLSVFDRIAYGIKDQRVENNWVFFHLSALENRSIRATSKYDSNANKCLPIVQTKINEKWASLDSIYVYSKEGFLMPRVIYIDIFGESLEAIPQYVTERVEP